MRNTTDSDTQANGDRRSFLKRLSAIPVLGALPSLFVSGTTAADSAEPDPAEASVYHLSGYYFESCNCNAICPCLLLDDPTHGYCQAFPAWHIEKGHLHDVSLDGLNVAAWLYSPGNLVNGNWRLALYIDERASEAQRQALTELWQGKHGGYLETIASLVGELMSVTAAKIDIVSEGNTHSLAVEGAGGVEIAAIEGPEGSTVTVRDTPLAVGPPHPITAYRSGHLRYSGHGYDVELSGTSGLSSRFTYYA